MEALIDTKTPSVEKLYRGTTNWIRLLPDFIIIGTQRGGTTSLYSYLASHPSVGPASTKEVHFFDNKYTKGLAWYRAHFPSAIEKYYAEHIQKRKFITGESSPYYLFHPHVPKRVAKDVPHAKFIVLLRNPVDRAILNLEERGLLCKPRSRITTNSKLFEHTTGTSQVR